MNAITDQKTDKMMEHHHLITNALTKETWQKAAGSKFRSLMNGLQQVIKATKTMYFIMENKIPTGLKLIYAHFCCNY